MADSTPLLAHLYRLIDPSAADLGSDAVLLGRFVDCRDQAAFAVLTAKLKLASALVLMVGVVGVGFGTLAHPLLAVRQQNEKHTTEPTPTAKQSAQPRSPKEKPLTRTDRYGDALPPGALARLGTIRLRSGGTVFFLFCLPDRKSVLSVGTKEEQMVVCQWRTTTGELLRRWETPMRLVRDAVLSREGKTLITTGYTRAERVFRVRMWDVASGKVTGELMTGGSRVLALALAPNDKILATADDRAVRLWDRRTGTEIRRCQGEQDVWSRLAFSADGKILAAASARRPTIQLWDAATGKELRTVEHGLTGALTLVFSPDGKLLATAAADDKTIRLWDTATGKNVRELQAGPGTSAIAFSPDGKLFASGDVERRGKILTPSAIRLWDANTGREVRRWPAHLFGVSTVAFSADGKQLVSSSGGPLHIWDVATGKDVLPFVEHEGYVYSVACSPDGRVIVTGGLDGAIRLWQPAIDGPPRLLENGHRHRVWRVGFTSDGRTLNSYGDDQIVRFWDPTSGREKHQLPISDKWNSSSFAYSPEGRTLAFKDGDSTIRLLDAVSGKEQKYWTSAASGGGLLQFSPDGKRLASMIISRGDDGGVLQLWDAAKAKELHKWTVAPAGRIVFSSDGQTLFGVSNGFSLPLMGRRTFHVWDATTGVYRPFVADQPARVFSLATSPDGRMLAWGDAEGTVTLWDLAATQIRRRLKGHSHFVYGLAFSADGKTLASGSADTTALVWDATGLPATTHAGPLTPERLLSLWTDLASKDAAKAFDAIGLLIASPEQAVLFLKAKLRAAPAPVERRQAAQLLTDLDSDVFAVREKAMEQLRQLGERAEPALAEALKNKPALEARKRIEELMERIRELSASPERLRELRAVEVLEHIGTPEARQVLQVLADGAAHARLTREAKVTLTRLDTRPTPP